MLYGVIPSSSSRFRNAGDISAGCAETGGDGGEIGGEGGGAGLSHPHIIDPMIAAKTIGPFIRKRRARIFILFSAILIRF